MKIVKWVGSDLNFPQSACAHIMILSCTQGRNTDGGSGTPIHIFPGSPICRYWKVGHCTKADQCQYRHNPEVSQVAPFQNLTSEPEISKEEAVGVTSGDNWRLRAARRQKENDAGNISTLIVEHL